MLLGIVLALAADEWAQFAQPCRAFLAGSSAASQTTLVTAMISKLMLGLADAARGNEDAFILHARRLATAIQVRSLIKILLYVKATLAGTEASRFQPLLRLMLHRHLHQ